MNDTQAPLILADGDHDDAPGFQAMIDGKPYRFQGSTYQASNNQEIKIKHGTFRLGKPLLVDGRNACRLEFTDTTFFMAGHLSVAVGENLSVVALNNAKIVTTLSAEQQDAWDSDPQTYSLTKSGEPMRFVKRISSYAAA